MSEKFIKTKPSLMEAGLPCSSLSAECQRDNSASCRPPQNTLHIWWARRAPTVCRAAILGSVLPHDFVIESELLPSVFDDPSEPDLDELSPRLREHRDFLASLLQVIPATRLTLQHQGFLRALGIRGDSARALSRLAAANELNPPLTLGSKFGYRHPPAFSQSPTAFVLGEIMCQAKKLLHLDADEPVVCLDFMAGGGSIPLEAVRYGFKVYANDLNPVAAIVLKATIEYPAAHGKGLSRLMSKFAAHANNSAQVRLTSYFPRENESDWWSDLESKANRKFKSRQVATIKPGGASIPRFYLWCRTITCGKCRLEVPLSTNFSVLLKGAAEEHLAAFPEVPIDRNIHKCMFRIVRAAEWKNCRWPRLGDEPWHPRTTPTFKDGHAVCPRCGSIIDQGDVKKAAQSRPGGLPSQMYAVCSQVPVKLDYRDGSTKVRYLWRFRAPTNADLTAVAAAEVELRANEGRWASLIPPEEIPPGDKTGDLDEESSGTDKPLKRGETHWRHMFLPRQLLTVLTVLDEVRQASAKARAELSPDKAEAVAVYLAFVVSKVVNYNSVNTFWHYGHGKNTQSFSRHDFAFRSAFVEMAGTTHLVHWGLAQILKSYEALSGLIHGEAVSLEGEEAEEGGEADTDDDVEIDQNDEESTAGANAVVPDEVHLRPEVIVPTVTNNDAAALETPAPSTVHLICVDPPYYNNVQYSELSNFFYVWLKRALGDWPGLEPFFREELAETNREAVANSVRWKADAEKDQIAWQTKFDATFEALADARGDNGRRLTKAVRTEKAKEAAGEKPLTASDRAEKFYEAKMAAVFRRAKQLLHPAGRMVVMFNHKMTKAWRALGKALIEAGFEIRTSIPIHTEAESSLNIRGLDAARSTVLLLCLPRDQSDGVKGNLPIVEGKIKTVARNAASHFQKQGIFGTDLYLSALGPTLGEVAKHWPITDLKGKEVDIGVALDKAYAAVGEFRLEQILAELTEKMIGAVDGFAADTADKNTQALWLWLDTFQGDIADSDDVRKLAKSLDINPDLFKKLKLIESESDLFTLKAPQEVDLVQLARQQSGEKQVRGRAAREGDVWEERKFPGFIGLAVWNSISLLAGGDETHRGIDPLKHWLRSSGYGTMSEFRGAYAVTLYLLEQAFGKRKDDSPWKQATTEARRGWDLVLRDWRG